MSYDDDYYTDEAIKPLASPMQASKASPQPPPKGGGDAKPNNSEASHTNGDTNGDRRKALWDYVAPPQTERDISGGEDAVWRSASPPPFGGGWGEADWGEAPPDISMLLSMIQKDYWSITNNKSFYEQALFMAGYEDDAPIVPFNTYFPTYRQMSVEQLRSYFTIRKLLRQGKHPDVPLSYLFVYAYETLMQIGVSSPDEGYDILCDLRDNYPAMNPEKRTYMKEWLRDYVVWYGLSNHFTECFHEEQHKDMECELLNNYAKASDEDLFNILDEYSRHTVSKAALYKKHPDIAIDGVTYIIRRVAPDIEKHFGGKLGTLCFGRHTMNAHVMFGTAVFYSPEPIKEANIEVAPLHKFTCHNGIWKSTADAKYITLPPSSVRNILHDIDAAIRQRIGFKPAIKFSTFNPASYQSTVLTEAADSWFSEWNAKEKERKEEERHAALQKARESVSIDLGKLNAIREDADVVREKLIVAPPDEAFSLATLPLPGEGQITETSNINESSNKAEQTVRTEQNDLQKQNDLAKQNDLSKESNGIAKQIGPSPGRGRVPLAAKPQEGGGAPFFLSILLSGGDYRAYLRSIHTPAGVMVEEINNKAMDVIGDIVLEDDGENITIIDDYREDIKHLYD